MVEEILQQVGKACLQEQEAGWSHCICTQIQRVNRRVELDSLKAYPSDPDTVTSSLQGSFHIQTICYQAHTVFVVLDWAVLELII